MDEQKPPLMPGPASERDNLKKNVAGLDTGQIMEQLNVSTRRLRVLEERYATLQRKAQLTDQNMLAGNKKTNTETKAINSDLQELKTELSKIKETVGLIIQELKECAKKDDIIVLEKYLKLWEPVRFVTQSQVERIVREIIDNNDSAASRSTNQKGKDP